MCKLNLWEWIEAGNRNQAEMEKSMRKEGVGPKWAKGSSARFQRGRWTQLALGLNASVDAVEAGAILAVRLRRRMPSAWSPRRRARSGAVEARRCVASTWRVDCSPGSKHHLLAASQADEHPAARTKLSHFGPN